MQQRLAAHRQKPRGGMRVGVAGHEKNLEEQHAGRPHRGTAAKPRQDEFRHERLDLEQKKSPGKNRQRKDRGQPPPRRFGRQAGIVTVPGIFLRSQRFVHQGKKVCSWAKLKERQRKQKNKPGRLFRLRVKKA